MTVDRRKDNPSEEQRFSIIDTNGRMLAQLLKESSIHTQELKEIKSMLKRLTN
jgi:hypothetical protein